MVLMRYDFVRGRVIGGVLDRLSAPLASADDSKLRYLLASITWGDCSRDLELLGYLPAVVFSFLNTTTIDIVSSGDFWQEAS